MVITCISQGRKLYLRRIVCHLALWHPDPVLELRMGEEQARDQAQKLQQIPKLAADDVIGVE